MVISSCKAQYGNVKGLVALVYTILLNKLHICNHFKKESIEILVHGTTISNCSNVVVMSSDLLLASPVKILLYLHLYRFIHIMAVGFDI